MSFSILSKRTRRLVGTATAITVVGIIIYGFLSTYQQTKNKAVPKVNLVQTAIYGSDRTAVVAPLYEAVESEQCIQQLTFFVAFSSQAASSMSAESVVSSSATPSSQAANESTKSSKSSEPALEPFVPEFPLVNASLPKCLQQIPAPEGHEKLGAEGSVTLALNLAPSGRVERGEVEKSSGFPELDVAALKQVTETWQFEPCKKAETAVACRQYIRFRWQIK